MKYKVTVRKDSKTRLTEIQVLKGNQTKGLELDLEYGTDGHVRQFLFSGRKEDMPRVPEIIALVAEITKIRKIELVGWYDRNPLVVMKECSLWGSAPHSLTERWAYTVPADRVAFLELLFMQVRRFTAPTTSGRAQAYIQYTDVAGTNQLVNCQVITDVKGDKDVAYTGQAMILLTGDVLKAYTWDTCVAGAVDYKIIAKFTEFDV